MTITSKSGFTFIELIVVMGIAAVLVSFTTVSLLGSQRKSTLTASADTFIADAASAQMKAMTGDAASSYGMFISVHAYTIFRGAVYDPNDPANSSIPVDPAIALSTTFPLSQLVFAAGSGEIRNFSGAANALTITNTQNNEQKTVRFNQYGVVISVQ